MPPKLTITGRYEPSTEVIAFMIEGNRAGRDLAVRLNLFLAGVEVEQRVNRVYWEGNKLAGVTFRVDPSLWGSAEGAVLDLKDALDPTTWEQITETVRIRK